jgi:hypothetical protein
MPEPQPKTKTHHGGTKTLRKHGENQSQNITAEGAEEEQRRRENVLQSMLGQK